MIESIFAAFDIMRPILFIAIVLYTPSKLGVSFDVAGKPCSADEMRLERSKQLGLINSRSLKNILMMPLRFVAIAYLTIWLIIDSRPIVFICLFLLTLIPVYMN